MTEIVDKVRSDVEWLVDLDCGDFFIAYKDELCMKIQEASDEEIECVCWDQEGRARVEEIQKEELVQPVTAEIEITAYRRELKGGRTDE